MSNIFGFIPKAGLLAITSGVPNGDGYVTISTTQTITGEKTFDTTTYFNANLYTQNLLASNNVQGTAVTAGHIYPTNSIVFPDGSSQLTAYKSLTPGTYSTCTITVDADGAISTITSGSSNSANVVLCASPPPIDTYAICFAAQGTNGYKQIYQDYGVLTYDYANSKLFSNQLQSTSLTTTNFSCSNVNTPLYNPSSSVPLTLGSGAGQGVQVNVNNGTPAFQFGTSTNTSNFPLNCYAPASGAAALGLGIGGGDQIQFYPTITNSSDWNPLTLAGQSAILGRSASTASTQSLVLTVWAAMSAGVQINPTNVVTASGVNRMTIDGTSNTITLNAANCPTAIGFTLPGTSDNSSNLATTQWVQSVIATIPAGSATAINMTDNSSSTSTYALCYGTTSPDGSKAVYQDYTGLTYVPSTNALTAGLINGVSFKLDVANNLYAGVTSTFPFFGQGGGYQNVTYGPGAGQYCTTGYANVYVGYRAGYSDPYSSGPATGHSNVCVGVSSGYSLMDGSDNVLIGHNAGYHLNGNVKNICIGSSAGSSTTLVGNNNVLIGYNVQPSLTLEDNAVVLGGSSSVNYYFGSSASVYNMPGFISGGSARFYQTDGTNSACLSTANLVDDTYIFIHPDVAASGNFNPITLTGQANILGRSGGTSGNKSLVLTVWSNYPSGVQINPDNIYIGGMMKQDTLTLDYTTTTFPYTLPYVLPAYVFIKCNTTATKGIVFPVPVARYNGVRITFRKTPNPGNYYGDISFTITGGGAYFCEYNTINVTTSQSFSSGSIAIDFICDGFYWYAMNVV